MAVGVECLSWWASCSWRVMHGSNTRLYTAVVSSHEMVPSPLGWWAVGGSARVRAPAVHLLHVISFAVWPRATRPRRQPGTARAPPAPARLAGAPPGDVKRRRRPLERYRSSKPCISHPLARTRDGPSLDGRGTTGRTEDLLETKRGISKATRNYRYKKKESLAFAASRFMSSRSSRESARAQISIK